jgi:hypothetical protein
MGRVNEEFDHQMIDMIKRRDIDAMLALTDDYHGAVHHRA